jgi:hypothetical protein
VLECWIVGALAFAKFYAAQRHAETNTISSQQLSPTDRNNPTDNILFYPLGCFYPLEKFLFNSSTCHTITPLLHCSITPALVAPAVLRL